MSDAKADEVMPCVSSLGPQVTGADIPEELFEHILWHLANDVLASDSVPFTLLLSNDSALHTLTSLILVCKYFANFCRPRLYKTVTLTSRRHLEGLLGLLRSKCAPFGKFLLEFTQDFRIANNWKSDTTEVVGNIDQEDFSWLHQVGTTLYPMLRNAGTRTPDVALTLYTHFVFWQPPR